MGRQRVVIIGAGFAGVEVAQKLKNADVDILLIDQMNYHVSQPLLFQVATGALAASEISVPIRDLFTRQKNCDIIMAKVASIDPERKVVLLEQNKTVSYDYLVVAPGSRHSYFGKTSWEQFAPGLKTIQDALHIKKQILTSFEKANLSALDKEEREKWMSFVIIGGGPHGVALAGALAELSLKSLPNKYKKIDTTQSRIYLIDALPRILPALPERVSEEAQKRLEDLGVQILVSSPVLRVDKERVELKDRTLTAGTILWAAGVEAPSFLTCLKTPLDRQGRVIVLPDMSIEGHRELFVIGDAACFRGLDQKPLPGLVYVAKQQASYVASIIRQSTPPEERNGFSYIDHGFVVSISRGKAVGTLKDRFVKGLFAWSLWFCVQLKYLKGIESRLFVFMRWIPLFFANRRHDLIIDDSTDA